VGRRARRRHVLAMGERWEELSRSLDQELTVA
jgi:hypothetical protein